MAIEDVFSITGRGTVVTGLVERGTLAKMAEVEIVGITDTRKTTATDLEMFRNSWTRCAPGPRRSTNTLRAPRAARTA